MTKRKRAHERKAPTPASEGHVAPEPAHDEPPSEHRPPPPPHVENFFRFASPRYVRYAMSEAAHELLVGLQRATHDVAVALRRARAAFD